ncbi:methyltransferase domain-containing protein [Methylobacterium nigriterrae]|uniref:methyltransferase domain-containing protein n=1 Tax=Methylobacterium nigriterrae TaxID=3127512 RepID=UPI003013FA95
MTTKDVSCALDAMFQRPQGLYGGLEDIPVISQCGHARRVALLDRLSVGDVGRMTCVDFGIGSWGIGSVYTKLQSCAKAIGMDISSAALEMSRDLVKRTAPPYAAHFQVHQSDGMQIPLPDNSVDLFFSGESIEHVKFPPRFLSEIHRVLRQDGQLVITTPNKQAIRYEEAGEEYCTSPEHFWLFDYEELVSMVSEFFVIREVYGFNGSFGSHEEDREVSDRDRAERWSGAFEHEPHLATGIVLRAVKRPDVSATYEIEDVAPERIRISGSDTYLPLEFGLRGLLLGAPGQSVTIERPPSDGIVCRMWCHRWSGVAQISADEAVAEVDLYTKVPGWRNWVSARPTREASLVTLAPTGRRNAKAESDQVIFFEAFVWRRRGRGGPPTARPADSIRSLLPRGSLEPQPGYGFARTQVIVSTTVFHWFTASDGNLLGPWPPVGGRPAWDGSPRFFEDQIKQMMMANIDAIYLHLIDRFEDQRLAFFRAYANLRKEGWDVPKICPYLDPFGLWQSEAIDVGTLAGKDRFAAEYVRWFEQYFSENTDEQAASYLLTIDGRLALSTWWVKHVCGQVQLFTREELASRLQEALGARIPQLAAGLYMITAALIDPDLPFSDERQIMFSGYAYAIQCVHADLHCWHVQPGYWDQNIRAPGFLLPRDGGDAYRRAWEIVCAGLPHVHRIYVESWNEYDEGSGIYAADPDGPYLHPGAPAGRDLFSQAGNPFEYIDTTAAGAARVNGRPDHAARILWHDLPRRLERGSYVRLSAVVQNAGNRRWAAPDRYELALMAGGAVVQSCPIALDDHRGGPRPEIVWRGHPVRLSMHLAVPEQVGAWPVSLVVTCNGEPIGEAVTVPLQLMPAAG